jgi:uncharacterized protein (DUF1778 family)
MSSVDQPVKVQAGTGAGKDAGPVSVRFPDARLEKMVRRAAVEIDTSRSEFMVAAAVKAAREVLKLQREADFLAYLEHAA